MRIAIFTNNYLPNPYGVTQSIESFRRQFEKQGHQVFVFAPHYKNYGDSNPKVFRYPALDIEFKIKFPLAIPYSCRMNKILENLKIDIIHSQHPNLLGTVALKWAKRKNIPIVFTWHTLYDQYAHFVPLIPAKWVARHIIKKAANYANKCDFVITPTESVKNIIQNWGVKNKNIEAVSTGVDVENFVSPDGKVIRDKYGIKDSEVLLLLVSRLTKEKNVEFILDSLIPILNLEKKLNPPSSDEEGVGGGVDNEYFQHPSVTRRDTSPHLRGGGLPVVKFLITGDGDLLPKLKETVKINNLEDKIIFEGVVGRGEIKNYYAAGDIFVYASRSETQGMIITEAMYAGLPIVAVDAPGICDLVENDKNGILVAEDKLEFAGAVEKLIQDKSLRDKMGDEGAKAAREKYTDKICAGKMLALYERLLAEHK